ncbi:MAG: NAD(P)-dependent oxidoreductase, partial [Thermodesulfobacteriota bacterium]
GMGGGLGGWGRVGGVGARRARGFDMKIHYHDTMRLPPELEEGATYHPTVEEMMPHCDFLTLHCVSSPETYGLLNAARIALLPDGAVVVNASRGAVIDEDALIAALKSGKLFAAGLDVYRNEPDIRPEYRTLRNAFLMPHIGSATKETRDAMGFRALDNLDAFFAGREPRDRVA